MISPKIDGYIKEVRVRDNQSVAAGEVLFVIDDARLRGKGGAGRGGGRDRRGDGRDLREPARSAAGDDRPGRGDACQSPRPISYAPSTTTSATRADGSSDFASRQRFETADADAAQGAGRARPRAAPRWPPSATSSRCCSRRRPRRKARLAAGPRQSALAQQRSRQHRASGRRSPASSATAPARSGNTSSPGTQLLSLVPLPHVYVTANFKETQLTHMRPGQPAEIAVDAYPDQSA